MKPQKLVTHGTPPSLFLPKSLYRNISLLPFFKKPIFPPGCYCCAFFSLSVWFPLPVLKLDGKAQPCIHKEILPEEKVMYQELSKLI